MVAVSVLESRIASNHLDERSTIVKMKKGPHQVYVNMRKSLGRDGDVLDRRSRLFGHLGLLAVLTVTATSRYVGHHVGSGSPMLRL